MSRFTPLTFGLLLIALASLAGSTALTDLPVRSDAPEGVQAMAPVAANTSGDGRAAGVAPQESREAAADAASAGRRADASSAGPESDRAAELDIHGRKLADNRPLNRNHPQVARVIKVQERHLDLLAHPAVVAIAVGLNDEGELAIVAYTRIEGAALPESVEGVPVDVRKSGDIFAGKKRVQQDAKIRPLAGETSNAERWARPVPIGVSTGHPSITAGTIGCRVTDGANVYALSNNHVFAAANSASIGDPVIQPGTYDGGSSPADDIGTLNDYEPILFGGPPHNPKNEIDAAVALTTTGSVDTATPSTGGYGTPSSTTVLPSIGMGVRKVGRTTGDTTGSIDAINAIVSVNYGTGKAHFHSQIVVVPGAFSAGGDSGSLIVTSDGANNPVGLLFAGSSSHTIANEIDRVLTRFGVAVDDTPSSGNAAPVVTISSPGDGSTHESGASITFTGSALDDTDGDLTAGLSWTSSIDGAIGSGGSFNATLSDGSHVITASVTDSEGATGTASISITVGTPTTPTTVSVASVTYATEGGRNGDKHLLITVTVVDDLGGAVAGATVAVAVDNTTTGAGATGSAVTGSNGSVTFTWKNAPSGDYVTTVTNVSAAGLTWDGATPPNGFTKP